MKKFIGFGFIALASFYNVCFAETIQSSNVTTENILQSSDFQYKIVEKQMKNKTECNIIPITLAHVEGFCAVVDSVAREKKYLSFLEGPSLAMSNAFVENNIKENWPHVVAIENDKVIGWCDISSLCDATSLHRPAYAHCGELGVGVIKSHRRRGVGKALMCKALNMAKEKGLERIELNVFEKNKAAIALYQELGFVIEGKKKKAVKIDEQYDNLIFMSLFL